MGKRSFHTVRSQMKLTIIDGESIKILIVGIGANKGCFVTEDIIEYTNSKSIKLHILNTYKAVKLFNKLPKKGLTACFHVNC